MEVVFRGHRVSPYGIVFTFQRAGAFHGINFLSSIPGFGQKKWEGGGGERS